MGNFIDKPSPGGYAFSKIRGKTVSNSTIGIKIANGEYYPILSEGSLVRRRLVLTTVNDNQESVQIDLFKGEGETIDSAAYIGSLIIEDIEPAQQGEPEIELVLGVDDDGNLNATASDSKSGERQSLSVSLNSLEGPEDYELPDFELNHEGETEMPVEADAGGDTTFEDDFFGDLDLPSRVSADEENGLTGEGFPSYTEMHEEKPKEKRRVNLLLLIGFVVAGLAIAVLILLLLLRSFPGEPVPPLNAEGVPAQESSEAGEMAEAPMETPAVEAPEAAPSEPVATAPEPVAEAPASAPPEPVAAEPAAPRGLPIG